MPCERLGHETAALPMIQVQREDGVFDRDEFLQEFAYRYAPGQHVILLGPTGRGKTTILSKMLTTGSMPKTDGLIAILNGPDPVLKKLGKPVKDWPPVLPMRLLLFDEKPFLRRYQPLPRKPEHFLVIRRTASRILRWMFARERWTLVMPDLQLITDPGMMGLGKEVDQLIITLRKRASSVWMDAQAARWIPRSSTDNTHHVLIWRNRDLASVKRLREIAGVDMTMMTNLLAGLRYHDFVWVDVINDEIFVVQNEETK